MQTFNKVRLFKITTTLVSASVLSLLIGSGSALAQDLSADDIASAISDKTYQGSMTEAAFAEYYAADGSIRADGYSGSWRAEENTLCFTYPDTDEQCWNIIIQGAAMTLVKDGEVDGSGMLVAGNPYDF